MFSKQKKHISNGYSSPPFPVRMRPAITEAPLRSGGSNVQQLAVSASGVQLFLGQGHWKKTGNKIGKKSRHQQEKWRKRAVSLLFLRVFGLQIQDRGKYSKYINHRILSMYIHILQICNPIIHFGWGQSC